MIKLSLITTGDNKKDKSFENMIERKLIILAKLKNVDEINALLIGLDIAIEYYKGKLKMEDQIRAINIENFRTRNLRQCLKV